MEDTRIVDLYWRRDETAISETEAKYGSRCRGIAYGMLSNYEDGEECISDSYMALWNTIPPQRPLRLSAYLFRVLRNLCCDRLKLRYAEKRGGGELPLVLHELDECLASPLSPQSSLEAKELAEKINSFLYSLSKDDRIIFSYRYWLAFPTINIAQQLGVSDGKVRTSLSRSRKKLHKFLIEEGLI